MPVISVTKNYADNSTLTAAQLDAAFDSVSTFLNTTKLDAQNIQTAAITNTLLAANSVESSKIVANAVTAAKLASDVTIQLVPVGAWVPYSGDTAPDGWLMCDGSAVSRTTYSALFGILGERHGHGDGSTTFNLPDMRGMFVRGADHGAGRDPDAASRTAATLGGATGDAVGSIQGQATRKNGLSLNDPGHSHGSDYPKAQQNITAQSGTGLTLQGNGNTGGIYSATTGVTINDGDNETRPTNLAANFIIKY